MGRNLQTLKRDGWMARLRIWFPDREFFMRSQGQVRFIKISARVQMTAAAIVAGVVVAWLAAMIAMIAMQFAATSERTALLQRESRVARAETRVSTYRNDIDRLATDLQRRQAFIEQVVESELGELPVAEDASATERAVPAATKISGLMPSAADLARIERRQLAFVERLTRLADSRAAGAEAAIRRLGLNPRLMLAKTNDRTAQGGPLLGAADDLDPRFQRLGLSVARMGALEDGLAAVPHSLPASLEYISSGFGYRSDPFTGAAAMHAGLDFRGPLGAPIYSAAAGRVTFAGNKAGYGNCIEIAHGNGMMTRYAHMSAFRARAGQTVGAGEVIGAIGNSGRSTGPHLHFEVRINDQPINPRPFLEGNRHVFAKARGRAAAGRG